MRKFLLFSSALASGYAISVGQVAATPLSATNWPSVEEWGHSAGIYALVGMIFAAGILKNSNTQMRLLGAYEQMVLQAILDLKNSAYGLQIHNLISERTGHQTGPGALYTTLNRLGRRGLVDVYKKSDVSGGKERRHFKLSKEGEETLEYTKETLGRMYGTNPQKKEQDEVLEGAIG